MHRRRPALAALAVAALGAMAACTAAPTVVPSLSGDVPIDCGPVGDPTLCNSAIAVAATAKTNAPPIAAVTIRRPRPTDDCTKWMHPCGDGAVIVQLQSGDWVEEVPLVRSATGWVRLDLVR